MQSATDTLNKLYNNLVFKSNKIEVHPEEEIEEKEKRDFKTNSSPFQKQQGIDTDFQGKANENPYTTNTAIGDLPAGGGGHSSAQLPDNSTPEPFDYSPDSDTGKRRKVMRTKDGEEFEIKEQDETPIEPDEGDEEPKDGDMELPPDPATTAPEMNAQQQSSQNLGMGGDIDGAGMDMMGTGAEDEEKNPSELGRIYELRKIYTRLTSIESYLSAEADPELSKMRKYVSQSIELFEILASNIDSYKEKMDDIIISYYKFLKEVYDQIRSYYKEKNEDYYNG